MTGNKSRKTSGGFTLLEVLTVLILLSLLIAMVVPLYTQSALWIGQTRQAMAADNCAYSLLEGLRAQAHVLDWTLLLAQTNAIPVDLDIGIVVPEDFSAYITVSLWPGYVDLFMVEARVTWCDETGAAAERSMITLIGGSGD